ncbi:MAG: response regulator [Planctomycetota bacterium]|jgi:CheY-like chemotaxis protein
MSHSDNSLGKILILNTDSKVSTQAIDALKKLGKVKIETNPDSIDNTLQNENFDLVVSDPANAMSAKNQDSNQPLSTVLNTIGQGVCIIELDGRLIWCNNQFEQLPKQISKQIQQYCAKYFNNKNKKSIRTRSLSMQTENDNFFEAKIKPVTIGQDQTKRLVVVVSDVTRARKLQQKMDAIDNAGRELVRLDAELVSKMDASERLELLEEKILCYTKELLNIDNLAIRILDKNTNKLELVLCAGLTSEAQQIDIYASTENSGISGHVAATGRSYICPDTKKDPRYLPGIDNAGSSLTVPLRLHDNIIGIFNVESDRTGYFSEDDRQIAEIFGRYIAVTLHILDLLVVQRHATTGRLADNVSSEIAGPLSDILADASTLTEEYIEHDDLRIRLQAIADNVVKIKESIKQVTKPDKGILGSKPIQPSYHPSLKNKKILVVDDEEIIRQTVTDVMTKCGCEVEAARDGNEAMAMINRRSYHLVITDIRMPGRNGYEIFAAVKNVNPDCPVIFMTGFGYDPNHTIIRARKEGLAAVLYKPFKVDQLTSEVKDALAV